MTARNWYLTTLPPFDTDITYEIQVLAYQIFELKKNSQFICKSNYIQLNYVNTFNHSSKAFHYLLTDVLFFVFPKFNGI